MRKKDYEILIKLYPKTRDVFVNNEISQQFFAVIVDEKVVLEEK